MVAKLHGLSWIRMKQHKSFVLLIHYEKRLIWKLGLDLLVGQMKYNCWVTGLHFLYIEWVPAIVIFPHIRHFHVWWDLFLVVLSQMRNKFPEQLMLFVLFFRYLDCTFHFEVIWLSQIVNVSIAVLLVLYESLEHCCAIIEENSKSAICHLISHSILRLEVHPSLYFHEILAEIYFLG